MNPHEQKASYLVDGCTELIENDDAPVELRDGANAARDALLNALIDYRTEREEAA